MKISQWVSDKAILKQRPEGSDRGYLGKEFAGRTNGAVLLWEAALICLTNGKEIIVAGSEGPKVVDDIRGPV